MPRQKRVRCWDCGHPCGKTHPSEAGAQRCIELHLSRRRREERLERDKAIVRAILRGMPTAQAVEQFGLTQQGVYVMLKRQFARIGKQNMKGIPTPRRRICPPMGAALLKLMERWWRTVDQKR